MTDVWNAEATRTWMRRVLEDMVPKLADSAVMLTIAPPPEDPEGEVKLWVELGASIMMDKPIMVLARPGQALPAKLVAIADSVVYGDVGDPNVAKAVAEKLRSVVTG